MHSHDLQAQHDAQEIAARLDTTRRQLREWHIRLPKEVAQEQQRYFQNPQPYKSLKHVDKVLGETGHRGIKAVRLQDGTVTNDPKVVLEEVLNSFLRQHNTEDGELSAYTEELISQLPKLYNRTQRRDMHRTPFTIRELDEVLYKLQPGKTPGVDRRPAELYRRLPLNLKRHLAARLWDIAIGKTDVPPGWANLVHPLYKKGDWANPDNLRPIVCATTEAKPIWMLILNRVAPAVYRAVPPTILGAIPGESALEAIFMQNAVVDMDPISLIITSLDVKGASPNTPHRLLRAVWKHMGLRFQGFLQAYLATRMFAIITDVGTTPWVHPASRVPQRGAEGPFLFLLLTLPLAFYIRRKYPSVAPYPLRTTLLAFADDMAVVTATARQPADHPGPHQSHQSLPRRQHLSGGQPAAGTQRQVYHHGAQCTAAAPPPQGPAHEPSKYSHLPGGPTSGHCRRGHPTTKPDTAADTDTGHSTHHGTLHPGPGILPTSRAQRSYRIPGLAPNAPPTHAASGRYHSATSVDHPRPPAHIATCNGTRGIATVLRRQHRSPHQQRVHSSHCGPPASSHAQS